jgi:hypothetical protein
MFRNMGVAMACQRSDDAADAGVITSDSAVTSPKIAHAHGEKDRLYFAKTAARQITII